MPQLTLPKRSDVKKSDTWDLASLYPTDAAWEKAFSAWEKKLKKYTTFKGKLAGGAKVIKQLFELDREFDREGDRLGTYAFLKTTEDQANSDYQRMKGRYIHAATKAGELASFIRPELLSIPKTKMDAALKSKDLAEWNLALERIVRYRPHTLSDKEEQLLAMQGNMSGASGDIFRQLNDADLKWPKIPNEKGEEIELSHSSFSSFLNSPKREVRENAFHQFYKQFDAHRNTFAASLNASNQRDAYYAKVRGFKSARESALFADNVPVSVYDNLIKSVRKNLPAVHRYNKLRKRAMKLKKIHHYDTYVPILSDIQKVTPWDNAVDLVVNSLEPLGHQYCKTLLEGMTSGRWCDRYPNQGKQSGAFSSGSYDGKPYILMNYQPDVLDHVFTLAHEAGHSMHSYYSGKHQPFQYYNYTIFVAEVASTFNEQLLTKYLMDRASDKRERAYLVNNLIDDIRATIIRQTMFAEFEKITHDLVEKGEPLTVETLRKEYRKLLDAYFGEDFEIDDVLELECLRIPHFYRAFYVYKYATGLSAAIALSQKVLNGGAKELNAYLSFLQGGCSKWPLDLLKDAGVDMSKPAPVDAAMKRFGELVDELDELL
ncbi:MAG TPA: oligoendopeptidase F [Tepidisphaeraceae bacterium]|nr:oligoendopeptidase F [Tepidisphaeraceae bacterium]